MSALFSVCTLSTFPQSLSLYFIYAYHFFTYLFFLLLQSDRLKQIQAHLGTLNSLCLVLGLDFKQTISEVHPSLDNSEGCKNISLDTIERLAAAIKKLRDVKLQRMQRVRNVLTSLSFLSF